MEWDYLNDAPLVVRNSYRFGVSAYVYNPQPQLSSDYALISPMAIVEAIPQAPKLGVQYHATIGETLSVTHTMGSSDGTVT